MSSAAPVLSQDEQQSAARQLSLAMTALGLFGLGLAWNGLRRARPASVS